MCQVARTVRSGGGVGPKPFSQDGGQIHVAQCSGGGGGVLERTAGTRHRSHRKRVRSLPPSVAPSIRLALYAGCNSGPPPRDSPPPSPPSRTPLSRGPQRGRGIGWRKNEEREGGREGHHETVLGREGKLTHFERRRVRAIISTRNNYAVNDGRRLEVEEGGRGREVRQIQPGFP